jgi:hypothetical protein
MSMSKKSQQLSVNLAQTCISELFPNKATHVNPRLNVIYKKLRDESTSTQRSQSKALENDLSKLKKPLTNQTLNTDEAMHALIYLIRQIEKLANGEFSGAEKKQIVLQTLRIIMYQFHVDDVVCNFVYVLAGSIIDEICSAFNDKNYFGEKLGLKEKLKRVFRCC